MSNVITARVSDDLLAMIDRLATSRERSRAWIVGKLIEDAVQRQVAMDDFIAVGKDDIAAGRTISHDQLIENMKARRKQRAAA